MRQMAEKKKAVEMWRGLEKRAADLTELLRLAEEDTSLLGEIEAEIDKLSIQLDDLEFQMAFSGEFDNRNGIGNPRRRRRHRIAGLGGDVDANVPALGRAPWLQDGSA